jgi:four helix bundle protein
MSGSEQRPTSNVQRPTFKLGDGRQAAYDLEERILAYAVRVVRVVDGLPKSRGGDHLGAQLLRSGTSPALNHGEAQAAESRNDFIHKMRICLKELRESRRTLRIIAAVPLANDLSEIQSLIGETEELIRIFFTAIRTAIERRSGNRVSSARVAEDSPLETSADPTETMTDDPLTGANTWTLDVERWTLDVERASPSSGKEARG